jgi:hypothetical protein
MPDDVAKSFVNGESDATALLLLETEHNGKFRNCAPHHREQPRIA